MLELLSGERSLSSLNLPRAGFYRNNPGFSSNRLGISLEINPDNSLISDYAVQCARNPDPGSEYELMYQQLKNLDDKTLLNVLLQHKFDGHLYANSQKVIGHVFYQLRQSELHVFSVGVDPEVREQGLAKYMLLGVLNHARMTSVPTVRMGAGGSVAMQRIVQALSNVATELRINVGENGYIDILQ